MEKRLTAKCLIDAGITSDEKRAELLATDVYSTYLVVAPCIADPEFPYWEAAEALMRGTAYRWCNSDTSDDVTAMSHAAGSFSESFSYQRKQATRTLLPAELRQAQELCKMFRGGGATGVDTVSMLPDEWEGDTTEWAWYSEMRDPYSYRGGWYR